MNLNVELDDGAGNVNEDVVGALIEVPNVNGG